MYLQIYVAEPGNKYLSQYISSKFTNVRIRYNNLITPPIKRDLLNKRIHLQIYMQSKTVSRYDETS